MQTCHRGQCRQAGEPRGRRGGLPATRSGPQLWPPARHTVAAVRRQEAEVLTVLPLPARTKGRRHAVGRRRNGMPEDQGSVHSMHSRTVRQDCVRDACQTLLAGPAHHCLAPR